MSNLARDHVSTLFGIVRSALRNCKIETGREKGKKLFRILRALVGGFVGTLQHHVCS